MMKIRFWILIIFSMQYAVHATELLDVSEDLLLKIITYLDRPLNKSFFYHSYKTSSAQLLKTCKSIACLMRASKMPEVSSMYYINCKALCNYVVRGEWSLDTIARNVQECCNQILRKNGQTRVFLCSNDVSVDRFNQAIFYTFIKHLICEKTVFVGADSPEISFLIVAAYNHADTQANIFTEGCFTLDTPNSIELLGELIACKIRLLALVATPYLSSFEGFQFIHLQKLIISDVFALDTHSQRVDLALLVRQSPQLYEISVYACIDDDWLLALPSSVKIVRAPYINASSNLEAFLATKALQLDVLQLDWDWNLFFIIAAKFPLILQYIPSVWEGFSDEKLYFKSYKDCNRTLLDLAHNDAHIVFYDKNERLERGRAPNICHVYAAYPYLEHVIIDIENMKKYFLDLLDENQSLQKTMQLQSLTIEVTPAKGNVQQRLNGEIADLLTTVFRLQPSINTVNVIVYAQQSVDSNWRDNFMHNARIAFPTKHIDVVLE